MFAENSLCPFKQISGLSFDYSSAFGELRFAPKDFLFLIRFPSKYRKYVKKGLT